MKKINYIATFLMLLVMPLLSLAMEQQPEEGQHTSWNDLPAEMKQAILSFALPRKYCDMNSIESLEIDTLEIFDVISTMRRLRGLDRNTNAITPNAREFTDRIIQFWLDKKENAALICFLDRAAQLGFTDMLQLALDKGVSSEIIVIMASRNNCMELCEQLIKTEEFNQNKDAIFRKAIYLHQYDTVKDLLDAVSDYTLPRLRLAIECGDLAIIKLLLEGIDLNNSEHGECLTPLGCAAKWGLIDIMQLLLDNGALVNEKMLGQMTPLMMAAMVGQVEAVRFLLENGALVDQTNIYGGTALMVGAVTGTAEVVALLMDNNADINLKSNEDLTALMKAAEHGRAKVVELLLSKKPKFVGKALSIAREKGHKDIVRLLAEYLEKNNESEEDEVLNDAPKNE